MGLGKPAEGDAEQIGAQRCDADVLQAVHDQAVVDFVGEDHEAVFAGDLDDFLQHFLRIERTGGVVGVDDDDRLGARGYFRADVVDVGIPIRLLVASVVHGGAARQGDACGPQGVVGRGDEHFVAIVAERLHAHVDQLADAVAGVDAFHGDVGQSLDLRVLHDRLARAEQAVAVGIAFAVGKLTAHVQDHLVDGAEAEGGRVTDIELEYVGTHLLHTVRFVDDGAADVVEDVIELGGFTQFAHGGSFRGTGVGGGSGFGWIGLPFRQGIALRVAWKGFARRRVLHGYRAFFACGRRVLRGGSFRSGLRSGGKPAFRNEEGAGEEGEGVGPGDALAAQVLADLALSQLPSLRLRDAD